MVFLLALSRGQAAAAIDRDVSYRDGGDLQASPPEFGKGRFVSAYNAGFLAASDDTGRRKVLTVYAGSHPFRLHDICGWGCNRLAHRREYNKEAGHHGSGRSSYVAAPRQIPFPRVSAFPCGSRGAWRSRHPFVFLVAGINNAA